ncbi:MAG: glycosyltransferase [Clostridia bacterium]|nr:glycosyltransferase [Clostridia bacterium]
MRKKKILITAHSMEIGGIERSLVGLLDVIDYERYDVDLLLFSRKGELLPFVNERCTVLPQIAQCATMLEPIRDVLLHGHVLLASARLLSRARMHFKYKAVSDSQRADAMGYALLQSHWDASVRFMPPLRGEYDAAISFMWPHHYVAQKVQAKKKFAWIHTDFTMMDMDKEKDARIWSQFDRIAAVSDECGAAFLQVYPQFRDKLVTIENILPQSFVRKSAAEFEPQEMQGEGYRLLSVGRFCFAKAFDRAAKVSRILKDRGVPFCWYIVGYGGGEAQLRAQIADSGVEDCFVLLGKKSNPYPYMAACDLYLQPSRYEGKAVTVREAQMLARPVLITDFKTARSQVRDGFDAVIAPQDETALADAIESLLRDEDLRKTLSENTKTADYSNTAEIEKIYSLIEE